MVFWSTKAGFWAGSEVIMVKQRRANRWGLLSAGVASGVFVSSQQKQSWTLVSVAETIRNFADRSGETQELMLAHLSAGGPAPSGCLNSAPPPCRCFLPAAGGSVAKVRFPVSPTRRPPPPPPPQQVDKTNSSPPPPVDPLYPLISCSGSRVGRVGKFCRPAALQHRRPGGKRWNRWAEPRRRPGFWWRFWRERIKESEAGQVGVFILGLKGKYSAFKFVHQFL